MRPFLNIRRATVAFLILVGMGAVWASPSSAAASNSTSLFEVLASEAGIAVLRDTAAGRELALKILGREIEDAAGVEALKLRYEGLEKFSQELRSQLEALASKALTLENRPTVWFEPLSEPKPDAIGSRTYSAGREEWLHAVSPASVGSTFETAVPIEKGSVSERLSSTGTIDQKLSDLENRYFREKHLLQPDLAADELRVVLHTGRVTLKQVIRHLVELRQELAQELELLAQTNGKHDPFLHSTFVKAAQKIRMSQGALTHLAEKGPALELIEYVNGHEYLDIGGYTGVVPGEMGELRVAMRVAGVVERGLLVRDLGRFFPKGPIGDAARLELRTLGQSHSELMGKELDLIMGDGLEWGEVKAYASVFSRSHRFYSKVISQAQLTLEIKNLLETNPVLSEALKAMTTSVRLRIYFLNGVTEEAAQDLELLGIRVFGVRYLGTGVAAVAPQLIYCGAMLQGATTNASHSVDRILFGGAQRGLWSECSRPWARFRRQALGSDRSCA